MVWLWIIVGALVVYGMVALLAAVGASAKKVVGVDADATYPEYRMAERKAAQRQRQREDSER